MSLNFCVQIRMKVSNKVILLFLMGLAKHSQSSQNSKLAMSLQYLKKEVLDEVDFCVQINIKVSFKLISTLWASQFPKR